MEDQTSLKQIIQSLVPEGGGVIEGIVSSDAPLQITLSNDSKMVLSSNSLIVPEHLTDRSIDVDIMMDNGSVYAATGAEDEKGGHEHPGIEKSGEHTHELRNFTLLGGKIAIYSGLREGQIVYLLPYNNNKQYYILDRKG